MEVEEDQMTTLFETLAAELVANKTIPNNLKPGVLAQAALETGHATTDLAKVACNFWALQYRYDLIFPEDKYTKYDYVGPDGLRTYFRFFNIQDALDGYWAFLHRWPYPYVEQCKTPEALLTYIGTRFCPYGYTPAFIRPHYNCNYAEFIIKYLMPEAVKLLTAAGWEATVDPVVPTPVVETPTFLVSNGLLNVTQMPTKNYSSRSYVPITAIVLHYTASMGGIKGVAQWFQNPSSQLSAHLVVGTEGDVIQCVNFKHTAWHAGTWTWNSRSIGIEIENYGWMDHCWLGKCWRGANILQTVPEEDCLYAVGHASPQKLWWPKYTEEQYATLHDLIAFLRTVYNITCYVGHDMLGVGRADPGPYLDWGRVL